MDVLLEISVEMSVERPVEITRSTAVGTVGNCHNILEPAPD